MAAASHGSSFLKFIRRQLKGNRESSSSQEREDDKIEWDNIIFHEELGSGAFGTVHRVTFKKQYKGYSEAAAKTMRVMTKGEVEIMQKLEHEHIVTYIGFYSHGPMNILLLELATGGSLLEYLRDMSKEISMDERDKWAHQAAFAIQYLHRNQCLHRDIKPQNCLLFENNTLKLCDFGISREIDCTFIESTLKGTYQYMAPEIINTNEDNKSAFSIYSDIYAYGMLLLTIYTRKIPFEGDDIAYVIYNVGKGELEPDIPAEVPVDKANVMGHCWATEPKTRPTIDQILKVFCEHTQSRHTHIKIPQGAYSVALQPNGDVVLGAKDKLVLLHKDGKTKMELKVDDQPVMSEQSRKNTRITDIHISPQGHVCVHKDYQSNIHVFSEKGAYLNQFPIPNYDDNDSTDRAAGMAFDRDGQLLVANGRQGVITAHECPSGEIVGKIKFKCNSRQATIRMTMNKRNQILLHFTPRHSVYSKVVAIDHSGNELFAFCPKIDEDASDTWIFAEGIVCDSHDNIIVAMTPYKHHHNGHIHKYSPTGEFLECIAKGLYYPTDISISHDDSLLAVANLTSVVLIPLH